MPIKKSKSNKGISGSKLLVFGRPGAGKTLSAASFDGAVAICTEAGIDHYEGITRWEHEGGHYVPRDWAELTQAIKEVVQSKPQWLVLDTIDNAVDLLAHDIISKYPGTDSLNSGKLEYGRGTYQLVTRTKEFIRQLVNLPCGLILTSHVKWEKVAPRVGEEYNRAVPSVQDNREGQVVRAITSQMDLVLFLDHDGAETRIRSRPNTAWESKDRIGLSIPEKPISFQHIKNFSKLLEASIGKSEDQTK